MTEPTESHGNWLVQPNVPEKEVMAYAESFVFATLGGKKSGKTRDSRKSY